MTRLVRFYPRWWRKRYGAEFAALLADLRAEGRGRWRLGVDVVAGALDARLRPPPAAGPGRIAASIGARAGVLAAVPIATVVVVSNVVRPSPGDDSAAVLTGYVAIMLVLAAAGFVAGRRVRAPIGPPVAGAVAGAVIAALTIATFAVVDNAFLDVVGRQQVKVDGLAHSHLTSMRLYVNLTLAVAAAFLLPVLTGCGAALGALGGAAGRHRSARG